MKNVPFAVIAALIVSSASADVIDFSDLSHGDFVSNQYAADGVNISAVNPNRAFDLAQIFDSNMTGTTDPDLEASFSVGNTALNTDLGNMLIIAERNDGVADDEGNRPAGQLIFDFDMDIESLGFHIVDLESETAEQSTIEFFLDGASVLSIDFDQFLAGGAHDNGVVYGNNSINHIDEINVGAFDQAVFNLGGSMAIDNISFTVPAPGALALLGLGGACTIRRRH